MFSHASEGSMRRWRRNSRGLAEIVGTLLLVLIVVAAAAAFSIFIAAYEAQLTASEKAAHDRSLEDIRILSLTTVYNGSDYSSLSFVIGSLDVNTMTVNELSINGEYINYFTVTPLGSSVSTHICALCVPGHGTYIEYNLTTLEQVTITVNLTVWNAVSNPTGGFLNPYAIATSGPTNYVDLGVYTTLGNDFTRAFSAPTAVAVTEQSQIYSGTGYKNAIEFDGSQSIVPANDSIVSWSWSLYEGTTLCLGLTGEKALLLQSVLPYGTYTGVLTIGDSDGLVSTAAVSYSSPIASPPTILTCSDQGPEESNVSLIGTGFPSSSNVTATFAGDAFNFTSCTSGHLNLTGAKITTTASGGFDCTFLVPPKSSVGNQVIEVTNSSTVNANTTFAVTSPSISVTPTSGPSGGSVAASGAGFTPGVDITFTSTPGTVGSPSYCAVNAVGTFSDCMFTVSGAATLNTVTATGSDFDAKDVTTAAYTVT